MKQREFFLTSEGFLELETELNYLKTDKRKEVLNSLKEARALGDLSENAEYDSAREEQGKLEARIKEVEYILEHSTIIEEEKKFQKKTWSEISDLFLCFVLLHIFAIFGIMIFLLVLWIVIDSIGKVTEDGEILTVTEDALQTEETNEITSKINNENNRK